MTDDSVIDQAIEALEDDGWRGRDVEILREDLRRIVDVAFAVFKKASAPTVAEQPSCDCSCHGTPGMMHVAACCAATLSQTEVSSAGDDSPHGHPEIDSPTVAEGTTDEREAALEAWENGNSQLEELLELAQAAHDEVESWEPSHETDENFLNDLYVDDYDPSDAEMPLEEWKQERLQEALAEAVSELEGIVGGLEP